MKREKWDPPLGLNAVVICLSDKGRLEGIKTFQEKRDAKF